MPDQDAVARFVERFAGGLADAGMRMPARCRAALATDFGAARPPRSSPSGCRAAPGRSRGRCATSSRRSWSTASACRGPQGPLPRPRRRVARGDRAPRPRRAPVGRRVGGRDRAAVGPETPRGRPARRDARRSSSSCRGDARARRALAAGPITRGVWVMSYVVRFADLGRADIAVAGGKGANLGELTRAGCRCRPASCSPPRRTGTASRRGRRSRGDARAEITGDLADAVRAAYRALGSPAVAVRSTATAEDLQEASFAGQQDTTSTCVGAAALLDAVRECWASLFRERAVAYRARQRIDPAEVTLAVVVQRMAQAEWAGVMFTANPTTAPRRGGGAGSRVGSASRWWAAA